MVTATVQIMGCLPYLLRREPPPEGVGLHKIQIVGDQRDAWLNLLVRAKHREWMGCWGVLGLLIVSQWIINIYIYI